ncbi:Chitin synthase, class 7, partial [Chytridiales sp. JEL 0842]
SLRLSSLFVFLLTFTVSILTFLNIAFFSSTNPVILYIFLFIFPTAFLLIYVVMQFILVVNKLDDRWPLADLSFGLIFFVTGVVIQFFLSPQICQSSKHYLDGTFLGAISTLLGVMMVYKFWDSITKEDLEFAVGGKANVWDMKDPLLDADGNGMPNDFERRF